MLVSAQSNRDPSDTDEYHYPSPHCSLPTKSEQWRDNKVLSVDGGRLGLAARINIIIMNYS
jgi:hypothetical protein